MTKINNPNPNNQQVPPDQKPRLNTTGNVDSDKATSYSDGYVHGRIIERRLDNEDIVIRDNDNAARGLLIGITLTALVALVVGAFFFFNQRKPVAVPVALPVPSPSAAQTPKPQQTTIIQRERTIEQVPIFVPVPQPRTTAPQPAPTVNINVPPQPAPTVNINVPQPPVESSSPSATVSPSVVPSSPTVTPGTDNSSDGQKF
jgi:hypothetical protein